MELYLRREYNLSYIAYGYRKSESLQRRGQLTSCDGFDRKFRRIFPISDWSEKDVLNYLKKERLPINEFYKYGYRDINFPSGEVLQLVKQNYPDDYKKIKAVYPLIEADIYRDYEEN
jgi:predicted phosphoadenosine phosphosulfate sulfurtransferase